jgi:hypothetical protein
VTRNLTSTTRLLDVLPLIDADHRVEVVFTVQPGSAFRDGLAGFLGDLQAKVLPWRDAVREGFDLAIAASVHAGLRRLRAPLIVLPHGAGYNRLVRTSTGDLVSPAGLSRRELLHRGRVVPTVIGLSHEEQLSRLRRSCLPAAERARVIGDPCFDRMVTSLPRREHYRRALGVGPGRRLVVLTSTWHTHSLLGTTPDLPERFAAQLPSDEYRIAVVLHPNVWSWHSPYQVRAWLRAAMDAGVLVIPPSEGWRAALIAADWVVGDHGSVTFYGAGLAQPTLLAAAGEGELDPDSPTAEFVRTAPRLDPHGDLRSQLDAAMVETAAARGAHLDVTGRTLGLPGESGRVLRDTLYTLMDLTPPAGTPHVRPVPPPRPEHGEDVTAFLVSSTVDRTANTVSLRRFPAITDRFHRADDVRDAILVVDADEVDPRLWESAEILVRCDPSAAEPAPEWTVRTLARYPGAALAAAVTDTDTDLTLRFRHGAALNVRFADGHCDAPLAAAGVWAWLSPHREPHRPCLLRIRAGGEDALLRLSPA